MFRVEDYIVLTNAISKVSDSELLAELVTLRGRISDEIRKDFGESKRLIDHLETKAESNMDARFEEEIGATVEPPLDETE